MLFFLIFSLSLLAIQCINQNTYDNGEKNNISKSLFQCRRISQYEKDGNAAFQRKKIFEVQKYLCIWYSPVIISIEKGIM